MTARDHIAESPPPLPRTVAFPWETWIAVVLLIAYYLLWGGVVSHGVPYLIRQPIWIYASQLSLVAIGFIFSFAAIRRGSNWSRWVMVPCFVIFAVLLADWIILLYRWVT